MKNPFSIPKLLFLSIALMAFLMSFTPNNEIKKSAAFIPVVTEWNSFAQKFISHHREITKLAGVTYYVDATGGNDTDTGIAADKAWKTIAKVNSFNFTAGDQVLFKRGETFFGSIVVHDNDMTYDAYGSGADPVITGFQTASSFTPSGSNKYEKTISADTTLNMVTIDDIPQQVATGANPDSANGGWKTYGSVASYNGSSTTRDTIRLMPAGMLGKHIIWKQNDWTILEGVVVQQWNDTCRLAYWRTLNIGGNSPLDQSKNRYGWKPYRDTVYIDRLGEYTYTAGKLHINLGSNPNAYTVKYAAVDTLFDNSSFDGTVVKNLKFTGGNKFAIWGSSADNITIDNCTVDLIGAVGIAFYRLSNGTISNCTISNCMATGIYIQSVTSPYSNISVLRNTLTKIGKLEGMGSWGMFGDYSAMNVTAFSGLNVKYNYIYDVGDCGIKWGGSQVEIAYNYVELYCQLLQDHGAYYNFWEFSLCTGVTISGNCAFYRDRWVHHNYGAYGIGCTIGTAGTTRRANIFYSDGINGWVLYEYNVGIYYSRSGLNLNIDSNVICRYNLFMPGDSSIFLYARGIGIQQQALPIRNLLVAQNTFIMSATTQTTFAYYAPVSFTALSANISAIGIVDSNNVNFYNSALWLGQAGNTLTYYKQAAFIPLSGFGVNDRLMETYPKDQMKVIYNWSDISRTYPLTGSWKDISGTVYTGSITVPAYGYTFLVSTEAVPVVPAIIKAPFRIY